jgi:hypothetical protein
MIADQLFLSRRYMTLASKSAAWLLCAAAIFSVSIAEAQPIGTHTQEAAQAESFTKQAEVPADPVQAAQSADRTAPKPQNPAAAKVQPAPVPEPAYYKLMLLGIAILLLFARRDARRDEPWTK